MSSEEKDKVLSPAEQVHLSEGEDGVKVTSTFDIDSIEEYKTVKELDMKFFALKILLYAMLAFTVVVAITMIWYSYNTPTDNSSSTSAIDSIIKIFEVVFSSFNGGGN